VEFFLLSKRLISVYWLFCIAVATAIHTAPPYQPAKLAGFINAFFGELWNA
jgi:hypothetical protein